MATSSSVLLYITHSPLVAEADRLIDRLNKPNRQYTSPYGLPDVIQLAPGDARTSWANASRDQLEAAHLQWCAENNVDKQRENYRLFMVADEQSAGEDGTVEMVYLPVDAEDGDGEGKAAQRLRAPIDEAVQVYTSIDGGQVGWESFMYDAGRNGGVLPKVNEAELEEATGIAEPSTEVASYRLPVLERPH